MLCAGHNGSVCRSFGGGAESIHGIACTIAGKPAAGALSAAKSINSGSFKASQVFKWNSPAFTRLAVFKNSRPRLFIRRCKRSKADTRKGSAAWQTLFLWRLIFITHFLTRGIGPALHFVPLITYIVIFKRCATDGIDSPCWLVVVDISAPVAQNNIFLRFLCRICSKT